MKARDDLSTYQLIYQLEIATSDMQKKEKKNESTHLRRSQKN